MYLGSQVYIGYIVSIASPVIVEYVGADVFDDTTSILLVLTVLEAYLINELQSSGP